MYPFEETATDEKGKQVKIQKLSPVPVEGTKPQKVAVYYSTKLTYPDFSL